MKNKKILAAGLLILAALCIIYVKFNYKEENSDSKIELEGEISFLSNRVDKKEELNKLIKEFEKKYPKTKVNLELIGDLGEILQRRANVQELSDVTIVPTTMGVDEYSKYLLPLDDLGFSEDNLYNYSLGLGEDGKLCGINTSITWSGIIYNKKIFQQAGIEEVPKTQKDFFEACEKIKKLGITPFAINYKQSWCVGQWLDTISFNFDEDMTNNLVFTEKNIFDSGLGKALDFVRDIYVKGYSEEDLIDYEWQQFKNDFKDGKVAMVLFGSDLKNQFEDLGMNSEDIGMFPVPETKTINIHGDYRFGVAKNTEYPNLSKAFLKFLFENDRYAKAVNIMSPMKNSKENIKSFDELKSFEQKIIIQGEVVKDQTSKDMKTYQIFDSLRKNAGLDYSFVQEYITSDSIETLKTDINEKWSEMRKSTQQ